MASLIAARSPWRCAPATPPSTSPRRRGGVKRLDRHRHGASVSGTILDITDRVSTRQRAGPARHHVLARRPNALRQLHQHRRRHACRRSIPFANGNAATCAPSACIARGRPALRQPQRRPARLRARRLLYIGLGDGGSGGDPTATARTSTRCSARSCASTRRPTARPPYTDPGRQPVRRPERRRAPRSGTTACATRGASASTAPTASCGSATSARTRARRSTTSRAGAEPA